MAEHHVDERHVPAHNNRKGWLAAGLSVAAMIACFAIAYYIHTKTYLHPRDVEFVAPGAAAEGGGH